MNRAGTTTHLTSPGRMGEHYTACGQHRTHLHAGQAFRSKPRAVPLAIAAKDSPPTCQRCLKQWKALPAPAAPRLTTATHIRQRGEMSDWTICGKHITNEQLVASTTDGQLFQTRKRANPLVVEGGRKRPTCQECRLIVDHRARRAPVVAMASPLPAPTFDRGARARELSRHPGAKWRFQTQGTLAIEDRGEPAAANRFDEVVVDDWLHAEMMDRKSCFVSVAGLRIWILIGKNGAEITDIELPDGDARHRVADLLQQVAGRL